MRLARVLVIGLTLCALPAPGGGARADVLTDGVTDGLEDAAADAAADTARDLLGVPAPRTTPPPERINVARCRRIAKQIVHFENVKDMADQRDNVLWANATQDHLDRLEAQWWGQCDQTDDTYAREFTRLLRLAARAAIKYFTWGAY
jgi:hypothetical protein